MINCDYAQVIISGILPLPEHKPDIERILRATCTPTLSRIITKDRFTLVCGELNISVEYVASVKKRTQPVFFTTFKKSFANLARHNHSSPEHKFSAKVEYEEFNAVSKNSINSFIILSICELGDEPF